MVHDAARTGTGRGEKIAIFGPKTTKNDPISEGTRRNNHGRRSRDRYQLAYARGPRPTVPAPYGPHIGPVTGSSLRTSWNHGEKKTAQ